MHSNKYFQILKCLSVGNGYPFALSDAELFSEKGDFQTNYRITSVYNVRTP